jgi:hypothetical protein
MREALELEFDLSEGRIRYTIPSLIVYGMSVIRLQS